MASLGNLKVSQIVKRLREGVDPDDIQETEAVMDAAADYIEALQAAAVLYARTNAVSPREQREGSK